MSEHPGSVPAVEARHVVRAFPQRSGPPVTAVDGVSLEVLEGEIFALLGPNGAGKTTMLEIIEGLDRPDAGAVHVLGIDVVTNRRDVQRRIGVQLQAACYFEHLTLREILSLFGSFHPSRRDPDELLELVGLNAKRHALVHQLSGGQAQRFSIVAALAGDPQIVFLDEPTAGLDPQSRRSLWELIRTINGEGRTIVLTTHFMEEAELLAHRVAIMDHGRIVAIDTPAGHLESLSETGQHPPVSPIPARPVEPATRSTPITRAEAAAPAVPTGPARSTVPCEPARATLEDVFLALTGTHLRD